MEYVSLYKKLKEFLEEHLLAFYDELEEDEKTNLLNDINRIDFSLMKELYVNSYTDTVLDVSKVSPLKCIEKLDDIKRKEYTDIGENLVKNGEYAVLIMAGGNGSRLGFKGPKGALELELKDKRISLFELFVGKLKEVQDKLGVYVHLYIMTSTRNNEAVLKFFLANDYFSYPKDHVHFFVQDELPIMDIKGHILLESKSKVLFGPNGNGNVFSSLKKSGLIENMKKNGIKYVLFTSVDDVLVNLADYTFIGATIKENYKLSSQTLFKKEGLSKDWIFCKYDGVPFMLPSSYINEELSSKKDADGHYLYRDKNILYHLISIDSIEKFADVKLPYHRAYKKNSHIDLNGNIVVPESPNSFKFEEFIFDAFAFEDDMLLYRIEEKDFCPIKTKDDIPKAIEALERKEINR